MDGREVTLCGWVHEVRNIGKIVFLLLRDRTGVVQVIAKDGTTPEAIIKAMSLPKESVVLVRGTVKRNSEAKKGFEIAPLEVRNLNALTAQIPFEVTGKVPADIEVRLDFRHIDLRRAEARSVFNIESTILDAFHKTVLREGFQEIRTPSIVGELTEGGADVFELKYFERPAYLAQSPQLYKQLAVIGGLDKVFMVMPVFRAEKHNTTWHLNEITQMDIEMGFADHNDVIAVLKKTVNSVLKEVEKRNASDLETLGVKVSPGRPKVITYKQAVKKLNANGDKMEFGADFNKEHEAKIGQLFGDLVIVTEYPTAIRAFYSMPNEKNPEISNSFDFIYKGMELCSGAQRIHIPALLTEAIKKRGMDPAGFKFYIDAMGQGAPPHAGWSIGLERFALRLTERQNIRECAMFPRDRTRLKP